MDKLTIVILIAIIGIAVFVDNTNTVETDIKRFNADVHSYAEQKKELDDATRDAGLVGALWHREKIKERETELAETKKRLVLRREKLEERKSRITAVTGDEGKTRTTPAEPGGIIYRHPLDIAIIP